MTLGQQPMTFLPGGQRTKVCCAKKCHLLWATKLEPWDVQYIFCISSVMVTGKVSQKASKITTLTLGKSTIKQIYRTICNPSVLQCKQVLQWQIDVIVAPMRVHKNVLANIGKHVSWKPLKWLLLFKMLVNQSNHVLLWQLYIKEQV